MLTRWDPFAELSRLQDQLFRGYGSDERPGFVPRVDISEDKNAIRLRAELPGMKAEDVKVHVEQNLLTLSGERTFEKDDKAETFHRIERSYGSFSRSFALPETVDTDRIEASYRHGVLQLTIAKKAQAQPRTVAVKAVP
ncbi:MAG: Hsp20/alpha crystallin family protein [Proteobacteria bacterium]|nr:Hsp20/alpha crystallin family protein [Pseudomonadota bacterium]